MNRTTTLRRIAPIGAALALGAGAGAGVYAGVSGGSSGNSPAPRWSLRSRRRPRPRRRRPRLTQIYKDAAPGVVDITVNSTQTSDNGFFGPQRRRARPKARASSTTPRATSSRTRTSSTARPRSRCAFQDGTTAKATLVGKDESTDIAVIKVDVAVVGAASAERRHARRTCSSARRSSRSAARSACRRR